MATKYIINEIKDITGKKFGSWTVIAIADGDLTKNAKWLCECVCGKRKILTGRYLNEGNPSDCGCMWRKKNADSVRQDLIGKVFGRWTVIGNSYSNSNRVLAPCQCECGTIRDVVTYSLTSGLSTSCGCWHAEVLSARAGRRSKCALPDNEVVARYKFSQYRTGAKARNIDFNLSLEDFKCLIIQECYYCGSNPIENIWKNYSRSIPYAYSGIDRVDNNLGYSVKNCVPCCILCNRIKMDHSVDFMYKQVAKIYNRRVKGTEHDV